MKERKGHNQIQELSTDHSTRFEAVMHEQVSSKAENFPKKPWDPLIHLCGLVVVSNVIFPSGLFWKGLEATGTNTGNMPLLVLPNEIETKYFLNQLVNITQ